MSRNQKLKDRQNILGDICPQTGVFFSLFSNNLPVPDMYHFMMHVSNVPKTMQDLSDVQGAN